MVMGLFLTRPRSSRQIDPEQAQRISTAEKSPVRRGVETAGKVALGVVALGISLGFTFASLLLFCAAAAGRSRRGGFCRRDELNERASQIGVVAAAPGSPPYADYRRSRPGSRAASRLRDASRSRRLTEIPPLGRS